MVLRTLCISLFISLAFAQERKRFFSSSINVSLVNITSSSRFPVDSLSSRGAVYGPIPQPIEGFLFELSTCMYPNPFNPDPLWKSTSTSWIVLVKSGECAAESKIENVLTLTGLTTLKAVLYVNNSLEISEHVKGIPVYQITPDYGGRLSEVLQSLNPSQRLSVFIGATSASGPITSSNVDTNGLPFVLGIVIAVLAVLFAVSVFMHYRQWRVNGRLRRSNSVGSELGGAATGAGNPTFVNSNTDNLLVMAQSVVNGLPIKIWSRKPTKVHHLHQKPRDEKKEKPEKPLTTIPEPQESPQQDTDSKPDGTFSSSLDRNARLTIEVPETQTESIDGNSNQQEYINKENSEQADISLTSQVVRHASITSQKSQKSFTSHKSHLSISSTASVTTVGADTCAICMEDYVDGDKLRELPCKHLFHSICIDKWLTSRSIKCPLCNQNAGPGVAAVQNIYINAFRYTYYDDTNTIYDGSLPRRTNPNNLSADSARDNGHASSSSLGGRSSFDGREAPWHGFSRQSVAITFPPPATQGNVPGERRSRHFLRFGVGRNTDGG